MTDTTMLSTRLPFAGFYETIWDHALDHEAESLADHIAEEPGRYAPALTIAGEHDILDGLIFDAMDYSAARAVIVRDYVVEYARWLAETLGLPGITIDFEEMTSPRYYNFETDRLFAKLPLPVFTLILARLDGDHPEAFDAAVRAAFTSRDGFASFYDNDPAALRAKPLKDWDHNELYVLLTAWTEANTDGESIDVLLYEDVEVYTAFSEGMDWEKLDELAADAVADLDDLDDDERALLAGTLAQRCPFTMELPL